MDDLVEPHALKSEKGAASAGAFFFLLGYVPPRDALGDHREAAYRRQAVTMSRRTLLE